MQFAEFTGIFMRRVIDFRLRFEVICHFGHSTEDSLSLPKLINSFFSFPENLMSYCISDNQCTPTESVL